MSVWNHPVNVNKVRWFNRHGSKACECTSIDVRRTFTRFRAVLPWPLTFRQLIKPCYRQTKPVPLYPISASLALQRHLIKASLAVYILWYDATKSVASSPHTLHRRTRRDRWIMKRKLYSMNCERNMHSTRSNPHVQLRQKYDKCESSQCILWSVKQSLSTISNTKIVESSTVHA